MGSACLLEAFLPVKGLVRVKVGLQFDADVTTQMVDKYASAFVLVIFAFFPIGMWQPSSRVAFKMIDGYGRAWEEVISFERVDGGWDSTSDGTGRGLAPLFSKLTGRAKRPVGQLCGCSVNPYPLHEFHDVTRVARD